MYVVAKLDKDGRFVGTRVVKKLQQDHVEVGEDCDLPDDGTYKWSQEQGTFVPLGHGFGRPKRSPISNDRVLYLIAKAAWKDMPQEVRDWCVWYEENLKRREEEAAKA